MAPALRLRSLRPDDEVEARAAHEVLLAAGYAFLLDHDPDEPWAGFVERVERNRDGLDLPAGWVRHAFLVAEVDGVLVGRASIRLGLNAYLRTAGGHIGYAVLPAHRRRGYATEILRQSIAIARAEGIADVLVTCDVDNVGSRTVIERCGGEYESTVPDRREGVDKRRYWIRPGRG